MFTSEENYSGGRKVIMAFFGIFFVGMVIVLCIFVMNGMAGVKDPCGSSQADGITIEDFCE